MTALTSRESKLSALAVLLAVLVLLWFGAIHPIVASFEQRETQREQLLDRFQRNRRLIQSIPTLRAQAEAMKRGEAAFALVAPSQGQAQEEMRQHVIAAFRAASVQDLTTTDSQTSLPAGWVGVRIDAEAPVSNLAAAIRTLENGDPHVVVEYLNVNAERASRTGHGGAVQFRLEVAAPYRAATPRKS